ncbi:hypothetical protein [Sulfurimonas sp.]|uniref:hypothetical protein n=1 Tax=Sulfurimonas sp. TaxID=2022749 RepID=UPI0025D50F5C|nr:hypothetical protein [Sulfurimonas sp.]
MAEENSKEKITNRIPLLPDSIKYLKKMVIDLDMDNDSKITPIMLGSCIDELIKEKKKIVS